MTASTQDDDIAPLETVSPFVESTTQSSIPLREAIGLYLLCLGLMLSAGLLLQVADLRIGLIVTEGGLILLPTLYFIQKNHLSYREVLHLKPVRPGIIVMVILITVPFRICSFFISAVVQTVFPMPEFIVKSLKHMYGELMFPSNTMDLALTILGIVVMAAICEEALFRGFILTTLLKRKRVWIPITVTAIGFALYHLDPWAIPEIVLIGIFLGWLVVRTGSIFPAVVAHASFNFLGIILLPQIFGVKTIEDFFTISFPTYVYPVALFLLIILLSTFIRLTKNKAEVNGSGTL